MVFTPGRLVRVNEVASKIVRGRLDHPSERGALADGVLSIEAVRRAFPALPIMRWSLTMRMCSID
jgi:hypothetical protein